MHDLRSSPQFQHDVEYLYLLGPRAITECLAEIAGKIGGTPAILGTLAEYRNRLTLGMIRAAGADRFPPPALRAVPRETSQ